MKEFSSSVVSYTKNLRHELKERSRDAIAISLAVVVTCAFGFDANAQEQTVTDLEPIVTVTAGEPAALTQPEAFDASLGGQSYPNQAQADNSQDNAIKIAALTVTAAAPAKPEPEPEPATTTRLARVYPTTTRSSSVARGGSSFASGYCTDYVARNVDWVDWRGNAKAWDENAAAMGHQVGVDQAQAGNFPLRKVMKKLNHSFGKYRQVLHRFLLL